MKPITYSPGCALMLYKPALAKRSYDYLRKHLGDVGLHDICCHNDPRLKEETELITVCSGCQRRFIEDYPLSDGKSFWEVADEDEAFPFPDHSGLTVTIQDACPTRKEPRVHQAVRSILRKMNIEIVEDEHIGANTICCGDDYYPKLPVEKVNELMVKRTQGMPGQNIAVYCVSCIKAMHIGGKKPFFMLDLLFDEETIPGDCDTIRWHQLLDEYIAVH